MNITTITVGWQETVSLPEYNNVRPSVSLTIIPDAVEPGEAPWTADAVNLYVGEELMPLVKKIVQDEVDAALEAAGRPPKYYQGTRYQAVKSWGQRRVLIIPNIIEIKPSHGDWDHVFGVGRGMSLNGLTRFLSASQAVEQLDGYSLETYMTLLDAEKALAVVRVQGELPY